MAEGEERLRPGRRGRRPGNTDTREQILTAARELFSREGYAATTVRGVARAAGVDSALVHHYFGTKDQLMLAAMEVPLDPREVLTRAVQGDRDGAAERLMQTFFSVWDDPRYTQALTALGRAITDPTMHPLLTSGYLNVILRPVGTALEVDHLEERVALVASQMIGVILTRYVLALEPIASMPGGQLAAIYAPTIQRYMFDDLLPGPVVEE